MKASKGCRSVSMMLCISAFGNHWMVMRRSSMHTAGPPGVSLSHVPGCLLSTDIIGYRNGLPFRLITSKEARSRLDTKSGFRLDSHTNHKRPATSHIAGSTAFSLYKAAHSTWVPSQLEHRCCTYRGCFAARSKQARPKAGA